jgi:hypothetical protein
MNLGHYIHELLYRYDCVIVPGFGGFVGNYAPARVHPVQHRFFPPSKKITFNKHLKNNDGLLANLIAQDVQCSFETAMVRIQEAVEVMRFQLKNQDVVVLGKVGALHHDKEGNLLFSPDVQSNYLIDSYGLSTFQTLPVQPHLQAVPLKEKKVIAAQRQKTNLTPYIRIAAAASLIFAMIWVPVKTDLLHNIPLQNTALLDVNKPTAIYKQKVIAAHNTMAKREKELSEALVENAGRVQWSFINDHERFENTPASVTIMAKETLVEATVAKNAVVASASLNFHVVGGCFGVKENAGKLLKKLKNKGYPAMIAGEHRGLTVVTYGSFDNEEAAKKLLQVVKQRENQQAWLLKK